MQLIRSASCVMHASHLIISASEALAQPCRGVVLCQDHHAAIRRSIYFPFNPDSELTLSTLCEAIWPFQMRKQYNAPDLVDCPDKEDLHSWLLAPQTFKCTILANACRNLR